MVVYNVDCRQKREASEMMWVHVAKIVCSEVGSNGVDNKLWRRKQSKWRSRVEQKPSAGALQTCRQEVV